MCRRNSLGWHLRKESLHPLLLCLSAKQGDIVASVRCQRVRTVLQGRAQYLAALVMRYFVDDQEMIITICWKHVWIAMRAKTTPSKRSAHEEQAPECTTCHLSPVIKKRRQAV